MSQLPALDVPLRSQPAPGPIPVEEEAPAPFITFYSFKGGVGRSMTLFNVASILAGRGFRVLVIDVDLEAPGLSFLGSAGQGKREAAGQPGLVELLRDAVERGDEADLFKLAPQEVVERYSSVYPVPAELKESDEGMLRILASGQVDGQYQQRLDDLNIAELYQDGVGPPLIAAFKSAIKESRLFDYVFVDSRTGFSDEAGVCTRDLADHLVVVTGLNHQNITGTAQFLRLWRQSVDANRHLLFVLSPIPMGEDELLDKRLSLANKAFAGALGKPVDLSLQIPYHPRLALTEEPHVFRRRTGHLYDAYIAVERTLLKDLGHVAESLCKLADQAVVQGKPAQALALLKKAFKLDGGLKAIEQQAWLWLSNLKGKSLINPEDPANYWRGEAAQPLLHFFAQKLPPSLLLEWATELHKHEIRHAAEFYESLKKSGTTDISINTKYANFLTDVVSEHQKAETLYEQVLAEAPDDLNNMIDFAAFLANVKRNYVTSEQIFQKIQTMQPTNIFIIRNLALLARLQSKNDEAKYLYEKAIKLRPNDAEYIGNYAMFLTIINDYKKAQQFYLKAIAADFREPNHKGNLAWSLFRQGRNAEGIVALSQTLEMNPDSKDLLSELWFYAYAHARDKWPEALTRLRVVLESGARSKGWDLSVNVNRAVEAGHPAVALLAALAAVISDDAPLSTLEPFPEWQAALATSS